MLSSQKQSTETAPVARRVLVRGPDEGEDVWFLDNLLTIKARGDSGAPFSVVETRIPAGSQTPFHAHEREDEAFYVLEGRLRVVLDRRQIVVDTGSYVHVPPGVPHGFETLTPVRVLVVSGVDGFVEMTREAGSPAPRHELPPAAPPDLARLERACARHGIQILGPLPPEHQ